MPSTRPAPRSPRPPSSAWRRSRRRLLVGRAGAAGDHRRRHGHDRRHRPPACPRPARRRAATPSPTTPSAVRRHDDVQRRRPPRRARHPPRRRAGRRARATVVRTLATGHRRAVGPGPAAGRDRPRLGARQLPHLPARRRDRPPHPGRHRARASSRTSPSRARPACSASPSRPPSRATDSSTRTTRRRATTGSPRSRGTRAAPAGRQLGTPRVLVTGIPHNVHHNGGRIAFGPDGYLYATTGRGAAAGARPGQELARRQDPADDDGRAPGPGQPLRHARVVLRPPQRPGHRLGRRRSPLGLGVRRPQRGRAQPHPAGPQLRLAADRGPHEPCRGSPGPSSSGARPRTRRAASRSRRARCGWPPFADSDSGGSRSTARRPPATPQDFLVGRYGRLRSVLAVGPDTLLVTTSNRDGRQSPGAGDDRILLVRVT